MVMSRLKLVLTNNALHRISIQEKSNGQILIIADVHGMKCYEARRFINNILNIVRIAFQLIVIHVYIHGTAIKEILTQNFNNNHIYKQFADPINQGITYMLITA